MKINSQGGGVNGYIGPYIEHYVSQYQSFYMYAFFAAAVAIFMVICVPETLAGVSYWKNVKLSEHQKIELATIIEEQCARKKASTYKGICANLQSRTYKKRILKAKNGQANLFRKNGSILYSGNLTSGNLDGQGKTYHKDGKTIQYSGEFTNNLFNGHGTYFNKYGELVYEGEFKDHRFNGNGQYFSYHKHKIYYILTGAFLNGKIVGGFALDGPGKTVGKCDLEKCNARLYTSGGQIAVSFSNKTFFIMKLELSHIWKEQKRQQKKQLQIQTKQLGDEIFALLLTWIEKYK